MSASLLTNSPTIPGHYDYDSGDNHSDSDDDGDSDGDNYSDDDNDGDSDDGGDDHKYYGITRSVSFCGYLASACHVRFITAWIHHPQHQSKGSPEYLQI